MRRWVLCALTLALGAAPTWAQVSSKSTETSALDNQIRIHLEQQYSSKKNLGDVRPSVSNRVVTLSGTVPDYRAKLEARHQARQVSSVDGVIDRVQVNGPKVPDEQLKTTLATRLTYDRMGMGQTFNAMTINVDNGVVTIGGRVRDYPDRDSALDIVADTTGVRGVIDEIEVAPLSPMDDRIRLQATRAIYGNPQFKRYAINPAKPIRIVVANGRVTLEGVVSTQVDKTVAGNAVRRIPGVFGVTNNLVIAR